MYILNLSLVVLQAGPYAVISDAKKVSRPGPSSRHVCLLCSPVTSHLEQLQSLINSCSIMPNSSYRLELVIRTALSEAAHLKLVKNDFQNFSFNTFARYLETKTELPASMQQIVKVSVGFIPLSFRYLLPGVFVLPVCQRAFPRFPAFRSSDYASSRGKIYTVTP